ncbi:MAG: putative membrane protein [Candidatus Midichloriaceae bacterium]|jgi:uncharacterized membrane protein
MKKTNYTTSLLCAGALLFSTSLVMAGEPLMEKCYGVAKAGKNDCKSSDGKNSCAGASTKNREKTQWVLVPKGLYSTQMKMPKI